MKPSPAIAGTLPTNNLAAIWLMVLAMSAFALADSLIRLASLVRTGGASAGQLLALQGAIGLVIFASVMISRREKLPRSTLVSPVLLARTGGDMLAACCMMTALTLMPVGEVSAILQVQPLVVTLGAAVFLREHVGIYRWGAIVTGFLGVMVIMRPAPDHFDPAGILVLVAILGLATRDLLSRRIPADISTSAITVIVSAAAIPAGILLHLVLGNFHQTIPLTRLPTITLVYSLTSSLIAITGYFLLTQAMRLGEISAVAPWRYWRLLAAFLFSYLVLSEQPDAWTIVGSLIVVAAGIFAVIRERELRRKTG